MQWLAGLTTKARVVLKTGSYESRLHSLLAGDGMAYLPRFHGDEVAGVSPPPGTPPPAPAGGNTRPRPEDKPGRLGGRARTDPRNEGGCRCVTRGGGPPA